MTCQHSLYECRVGQVDSFVGCLHRGELLDYIQSLAGFTGDGFDVALEAQMTRGLSQGIFTCPLKEYLNHYVLVE